MEREVKSRVVFETAQYSGAIALYDFVMNGKQAEKYRRPLNEGRVESEIITWGGIEDFEEYEAGHLLPEGTYGSIFELMKSDLGSKAEKSLVASIRVNKEGLFAFEDIKTMAQNILDNKGRVKGIGYKRAQVLLDGASNLIGISEAGSESFA